MQTSVLNKKISMCRRANEPDNIKPVNLLYVLQTEKYKHLADTCSQIVDKKERKTFKLKHVPVITVSGTFKGSRKESNLIQHSGLICLDLDGVQDIDTLKKKVSALPFVAYCGKSISGTGLFAIVPIPVSTPDEHKRRYAALELYFIKAFGITGTIDPQPKNVAAARYVSYDPDAYYNHNAVVFNELPKNNKPTKKLVKPYLYRNKNLTFSDYDKVWDMIDQIQERRLDFCPDYADYLRVAFSLANGLGENGRDAFHSICQYSAKYNYNEADKKYSEALKHGSQTTLGTFFGMCKDYGLVVKEIPIKPKYIPKKIITNAPKWYVDMQGTLRQYETGEITPDQFLNLQDQNCKQSGISEPEYVKTVKYLEVLVTKQSQRN